MRLCPKIILQAKVKNKGLYMNASSQKCLLWLTVPVSQSKHSIDSYVVEYVKSPHLLRQVLF